MSFDKSRGMRSNQDIRATKVRLVDENGAVLGIFSLKEALDIATQKELDLIEVSPEASPPVCKIADYGRLRYKDQKKKNEMKKNQKQTIIKEVQVRPSIQENDYQVKVKRMRSFLAEGDKVKVSMLFRGREVAFSENGRKILERMIEELADCGKVDALPKLEGKRMIMVLSPQKLLSPLEKSEKDSEMESKLAGHPSTSVESNVVESASGKNPLNSES